MIFKEKDVLEYSSEFKDSLLESGYSGDAIKRKFIYVKEELSLIGQEPQAVLRCSSNGIQVKVLIEHLVKSLEN
jgi:hypothetical protein